MADISQIKLPDGNIHNIVDNTSGYITAESPALTGMPTAPTPLSEASDTQIATVKYVRDSMAGAGAGSVTSVGIANATEGGLSVSGSPITGAGTITVGHSNVLASAQTTAGIYPIKIDKNGHISEYGNAVSIPVKTSDLTNDSGFITSQYIEDKTDYEIPVSRVGEIIVGETPIGTDSTNFPTSKAVVDYVDERVTQEIAAIDFEGSITDIQANGMSLPINNGVVNIPVVGPNQSVGLMTDEYMDDIFDDLYNISNSIPTSTSQLTNDSGFITASDIPKSTDEKLAIDLLSQSSTTSAIYYPILGKHSNSVGSAARRNYDSEFKYEFINGTTVDLYIGSSKFTGRLNLKKNGITTRLIPSATTQANITLPATTGTLALVSDIPTVPTNISAFTNDSGYITTDSDEKLKTNLIINSEKYYPIFGKSTTNAETKYYDSNISYSTGSGAFSLLTLGSSSKSGSLQLRSSNGGSISLNSDPNSTTTKDIYFQDKNGTVALTSDIPTVPTNISSFTNDSGYLTASDIASVMTYKGTKANYAALPSTGNTIGDVWHLTDTGAEWAWDGSAWQELGSAISVDGYVESSRTVDGTTTNFSNTGTGGSIQSTYQGTDNEAYILTTAIADDGASIELYASDGIHYNQIFINPIETYISNILTPIDNTDAANKKYVDDSIGAISIPTKTSDLTNDSGFITTDTNTTYTLSNALSSHKFTETLTAGGSGSGTSTAMMEFAAGTGITLTDDTSNKKITIACSVVNTDEKVKQTPLNGVNDSKGFLFSSGMGSNETTNTVYTTDKILWNDYSSLPTMYIYNGSRTKYGTLSYNHLCLANATTTYDGTLQTDGVTANRTYTLPDKTGIIALTSDIPDTSSFLTSETDPVFSASAAAGITATDISNWNAKVSDDKTWNGIALSKTIYANQTTYYLPFLTSVSDTQADLVQAKVTPVAKSIAVFDENACLKSTTPSANDNSTKVATTAYVDAAIPDTSGFVSKSGDTMTGKLTLYYNNVGNNNGLIIKDLSNEGGAWLHCEGTISSDTTAKVILRFETIGTSNGIILNGIETPSSNSNDYDKYAANKAYVDNKFNTISVPTKTSDLTNDSGFITTDSDEKVKQIPIGDSNSANYGLVVAYDSGGTETTNFVRSTDKIYINNSTPSLIIGKNTDTQRLSIRPDRISFIYNSGNHQGYLKANNITGTDKTWTLPDKTGTIALTSDIPDVSGFSTTDEKLAVNGITNGETYSLIMGQGASMQAATRHWDGAGLTYYGNAGSTTSTGTARVNLGNSIAMGTSGNKQGVLKIYGINSYAVELKATDIVSSNKTIELPNKSGTVALTSDIPSVYSSTNTGGYLTMVTLPIYDGTVV